MDSRLPVGATVLVADDDEATRELLVALVRKLPFVAEVLEARDGAEAVQLGLQLQPQVAVIDVNMPRLDGLAVVATLHELDPAMRLALHSADPTPYRDRALALRVPIFDKRHLRAAAAWAGAEACAWAAARAA